MTLRDHLDHLLSTGRSLFTTADVVLALDCSSAVATAAIRRLRDAGQVATLLRGVHLAVPPEYRSLRCLPPDQFVPDLMAHIGQSYYTGLLSAAQFHGAAHHAPMVFQVVAQVQLPPIHCAAVRVEFVVRHNMDQVPVVERNTPRGILGISSPEATAYDLVGYAPRAGGLSNVATVLADLVEVLDASRLADLAALSPSSWGRRLGWLLDLVAPAGLTDPLYKALWPFKETVPLNRRLPRASAALDGRWRILVNDDVEAER